MQLQPWIGDTAITRSPAHASSLNWYNPANDNGPSKQNTLDLFLLELSSCLQAACDVSSMVTSKCIHVFMFTQLCYSIGCYENGVKSLPNGWDVGFSESNHSHKRIIISHLEQGHLTHEQLSLGASVCTISILNLDTKADTIVLWLACSTYISSMRDTSRQSLRTLYEHYHSPGCWIS